MKKFDKEDMKKKDKFKAVIDTNLFISALLTPYGTPAKLLNAWRKGKYDLVISNDMLSELREVVVEPYFKKHTILAKRSLQVVMTLRLGAEFVKPTSLNQLPVHCRDPKDDKVLALSLVADADYLVTGDKDLLELNGKKELGRIKNY